MAANSAAQTPPFGQDWHDTTLISDVDDWSGVPGFVGYLGQDITTATGVDPQTLLTDSTVANDVDVIANIPPAVNIQNGGVGEFELDDAVDRAATRRDRGRAISPPQPADDRLQERRGQLCPA